MRISGWSSDVCSSDLPDRLGPGLLCRTGRASDRSPRGRMVFLPPPYPRYALPDLQPARHELRIGGCAGWRCKRCAEPGYARQKFVVRSEEHTSELQSLMRISYAVFCLNKKTKNER